MRSIISLIGGLLLSGCALQVSAIRADMEDYSGAIGETTDKLLVTNILEARDNAPMHFMELPKINGSIQATASLQAALPFVARREGKAGGLVNDTFTPTISVQSTPTFEVDNLDTKDFVTSVSSSVGPKFVKYWIDRGLDKRIILLLFFSSVQITDPKGADGKPERITVWNNPREAADEIATCLAGIAVEKRGSIDDDPCHARAGFELYLKLMDIIGRDFSANAYSERALIAEGDTIALKDAGSLDATKYQLDYLTSKKYRLYSLSSEQKIALCLRGSDKSLNALAGTSEKREVLGDICSDAVITEGKVPEHEALSHRPNELTQPDPNQRKPCGESKKKVSANAGLPDRYCSLFLDFLKHYREGRYEFRLTVRSVAEMLRFLGDLEYYQERLAELYGKDERQQPDYHHNNPVTLGWSGMYHAPPTGPRMPGNDKCLGDDGGCLFRLNGHNGATRFNVDYRSHIYSVAQDDPNDHTLEVLAVINQLLNLSKAASDIRITPVLQVVP